MTKPRRSFTVYSIRERISGVEVTDFDHVIRDQALLDPSLAIYDLDPGHDYEAKLFVLSPPQYEPDWA